MNPVQEYLEHRWEHLLEEVKQFVNASPDANLDVEGERCKNAWECYSYCTWTNSPYADLYQESLIIPACRKAVDRLDASSVMMLLADRWEDFLESNDPGVEWPWELPAAVCRQFFYDVLLEHVHYSAVSDGAEVEERKWE